ncbi:MAG TPA: PIN domain-containing protein [Candidatus Hydrogenedentes bacterium]|nr:PIN domain-containing protein [Candidatus Hydrogenedentota bacterium]HPG69676.1 PIN domain-containing protein [Candidatus Hydrogenedentota bacterium]
MIAVDTNVLVYAHRQDAAWHDAAYTCIKQQAEGTTPWAIPWPCIHEFLAVVTHPRIYAPPTPMDKALEQVDAWMESPSVVLLGEADGYWPHLRALVLKGRVSGPMVHDARVAALCIQHGVREIWTADRDFGRFAGIRARNPLL